MDPGRLCFSEGLASQAENGVIPLDSIDDELSKKQDQSFSIFKHAELFHPLRRQNSKKRLHAFGAFFVSKSKTRSPSEVSIKMDI